MCVTRDLEGSVGTKSKELNAGDIGPPTSDLAEVVEICENLKVKYAIFGALKLKTSLYRGQTVLQ